MKSIFENLINGNLTLAKNSSRGHSLARLTNYATEHLGMDRKRATNSALFLKGRMSFQSYCNGG